MAEDDYMDIVLTFSPPPSMVLIIKDVDGDSTAPDSGIDTDFTSDMESITSSNYAHTYGKRRSECPSVTADSAQVPQYAEQPLSTPER
jgi:hypothetical protein